MATGILIAILAQVLLGTSLLVDKFFLKEERRGRAMTYVFWIGVLNVFGLALAPFGFSLPSAPIIALSLLTGGVFLGALLAYYVAIERSEISGSAPLLGGFAAIATFAASSFLGNYALDVTEGFSFVLLALGGFFILGSSRVHFSKIFGWIILAAVLFGLGNGLQKMIFESSGFVTGFTLTKFGTFLAALALLAIPSLRNNIFSSTKAEGRTQRALYVGNRLLAGAGALLVFLAIHKADASLVEALSGFRYVWVLGGVALLTRFRPRILAEPLGRFAKVLRAIGVFAILLGIGVLGTHVYYKSQPLPPVENVMWGVTFSPRIATELGLDWRAAYLAALDELHPKGVRLIAYWNDIESTNDTFSFDNLDWQIVEARKRNIGVILAVGQKAPRWPECHVPAWAKQESRIENSELDSSFEQELLEYLEVVVRRYRNHPALAMWQIENEPFLLFGECPPPRAKLLDREIELVRALDPLRQILMTDGGEFGDWYRAAKRGDVFGTTLYRKVFNEMFGHITYPLTPEFYAWKRDVVKTLIGDPDKPFVVIEVGLEPWDKKRISELPITYQLELFSSEDFRDTIAYARRTGFSTYYLWGVEWWYWMKTQNNESFWNLAKEIMNP